MPGGEELEEDQHVRVRALQMCMRVAGTGSAVSVGLKAHIPDGGGQGGGQSGVALFLVSLEFAVSLVGVERKSLVSQLSQPN